MRIVRDGKEGRGGEGDYLDACRLLRGVSLRIRSVFSRETRFGISDKTESLLSSDVTRMKYNRVFYFFLSFDLNFN